MRLFLFLTFLLCPITSLAQEQCAGSVKDDCAAATGNIDATVVDLVSISPAAGAAVVDVGDKFVDCSDFGDGPVCNF